ncbi:MAG TPA: hypothetical protein VGE38_08595 [Nocardioides sp.]|uniref:hypothetical protein n=1 Tax=Nocardioides sp. TaxID=35761 RepID=UPI002ED9ED29
MPRLGTRHLLLAIDGVDYSASISRAVMTSVRTDERLLGEADNVRLYELELTLAQDLAADSLWGLMWARTGGTAAFYLAPYGNENASDSEPHYSGTVTVTEPDGGLVGGDANPSPRAVMTTQVVWAIHDRPERLTDSSYPATVLEGA